MTVTYKREGSIAYITLARGESLNAMNRQMYKDANAAFEQLNQDDEAKAAVFSSACEKAFCAGVDIKDLHHALSTEQMSMDDLTAQMSLFFEVPGALKKPVIAAINGYCVGEGMVMTLFCDIRIASDDAQFALPEAKMGVPSINGTIRAVQLAGHGAAMELVLTGETRSAAWAMNAGLINKVVPAEQLLGTAVTMATAIADNDPLSCQIMRQLGERALDEKFSDLVAFGSALRDKMKADDMIDRQAAFVERSGKKPSAG
jgi:(E)-benzylidenesuccinyl-CoA hydratase